MATDLEQKPRPAAAKYDTFVEEQLTKVRGRVRALDTGKVTLWLLIVTLAYALGMALVDRAWELSAGFRLGAFLTYLLAAAGLGGWILLCLARRINPYYAAKKLEETLPDAKNSVVNWLDLRDEKLPAVIHSALGSRAAKDLKQADPERAVSAGPTWILAGVMAGLILGLLILFVMGPDQFGSLLLRAFTPFRERGIDTRVSITMVQPADGDATVPPNRAVTFRAGIDGPVPAINQKGAPHLNYRFNEADPFVAEPLYPDADGTWAWTMPADRVLNGGLWYKITAGDAETPEYLVRVVPNPQVLLCKPDAPFSRPKLFFTGLHAPRGTEVTLVVQTNSPVKQGGLHIDWSDGKKEDIKGELLAADPNAMRFAKIFLDKGGFFSINFSSGSEENIDRDPYRIVVYEHGKPIVKITKPGNIDLPANGTLVVEGSANSSHPEIGIQNMTLRMKVKGGPQLEPKPYRPFKLVNGKYPSALKYMDLVALDTLKTDKGVAFPLVKGMEVHYWLEARDNTDYPEKNGVTNHSATYKVKIIDPEADEKKQEQERNQANKEQEQHEKQQNQEFDKQNKEAKEKQDAGKTDAQRKEEELKQKAEDIQKKFEKDQKNEKGEAKGQDQQKQEKSSSKAGNSDPKKDQQPENVSAKDNKQGQDNAGQKKEGPKDGQSDQGTEAKGPGQKDTSQKDQSQAKGSGTKNPDTGPQGSAKNEKANGNKDKSAAKEQPKEPAGNAKDQGMNQGKEQNTGQAKGPEEKKTDPKAQCDCKQGGKDAGSGQAKGSKESTGKEQSAQKGDAKKGPGPKDDKSQAKKEPGGETQVSEGKEGPVDSVKEAKGLTKGEDSVENNTGAKGGTSGENGPPPVAKGPGNDKKGPPQTASKEMTPEQSQNAGQARGEKGPGKAPTAEEIEKFAKDLAKKDPKIQEKAVEDLARAARNARDPKLRDAARKALDEANKMPMKAKDAKGSDPKIAKAESKDKGDGQGPGQEKSTNKKEVGDGKGEIDSKTPEIAKTKKGDRAGNYGPNSEGMADDPKADDPDPNHAKRGGNLTLEDINNLIKKGTFENRKKAKISEKEWQDLLKASQALDESLAREQANAGKNNPGKSKGTSSVFKTFEPSKVGPALNPNVEPLNIGQYPAPPEFRDFQRRFTTPPAPPEKK